jgi:hypothetical protein
LIAKGGEATILVNSTEADFELFVTVIVSGGLIRETMTLPKSCLSGLILSAPAEAEFLASGVVARSAVAATLNVATPVATASIATSAHTAERAELNVNMKVPPGAQSN